MTRTSFSLKNYALPEKISGKYFFLCHPVSPYYVHDDTTYVAIRPSVRTSSQAHIPNPLSPPNRPPPPPPPPTAAVVAAASNLRPLFVRETVASTGDGRIEGEEEEEEEEGLVTDAHTPTNPSPKPADRTAVAASCKKFHNYF